MKLSDTGLTAKLLKEKAKQYMIETYERFDMVADHAKGVYLYDEQDTPYLDFYAGIAVNSVGNCNEKVVKAVQEQAEALGLNEKEVSAERTEEVRPEIQREDSEIQT